MLRSWTGLAAATGVASIAALSPSCQERLSAEDDRPVLEYGYRGSGPAAREFVQVMESRGV